MPSKEELIAALSNLSPEQIQGILAQGNGRSPNKPRQLHNLLLQPSATDPRPLFIPSAEAPRDVIITHAPYPRLMWNLFTGQEITVHSKEEFDAKMDTEQYTAIAPETKALDPTDYARQLFESLSPEDQQLVLENQRQTNIARVTAAMAGLNQAQAAEAVAVSPKRGRPRKSD